MEPLWILSTVRECIHVSATRVNKSGFANAIMEADCHKLEFNSAQRANISEWTMLESLQSEVEEGEAELNANNKATDRLRRSSNEVSSS